jgi:hypothetical protein
MDERWELAEFADEEEVAANFLVAGYPGVCDEKRVSRTHRASMASSFQ